LSREELGGKSNIGDIRASLLVAGAVFGDVGASPFVGGIISGDVGVLPLVAGAVFGDVDLQLWEVAGARNAILHEIRRSGGKSKLCDWMGSVLGFHAQIMIGSPRMGTFHAICWHT